MASRVPLIWLVFLAMLLAGCDSAEDLVNRRLPPVPGEQHRAMAVQAAQAAIAGLKDVNAGFNLRMEDISAAVKASHLTEGLGIGQVKLHGDRQLIFAEVEVAKTFSKDDFSEFDANTKDRIGTLKPKIKGRITLGLSLTSAKALSKDGQLAISIHLLPLFRNMEVEYVALAGKLDIDLVVTLMNSLADKLSVGLARADIARVFFPTIPFKEADLSSAIALKNADGVDEKITISAKPVPSPVQLGSVAWLIDGGNITFISELAPVGTSPVPASAAAGKDDFDQLKTEFARKLAQGLGVEGPQADSWIGISKQLVAELVNAAFRQGQPCLAVEASLADRIFSKSVVLPDNMPMDCTPEIDCGPTKDCSPASICDQAENCGPTRDCKVCALGACFNDPTCERQNIVASQNCEVRKELRKIACQRLGAPQKAACESDRAADRASCEAGKSARKLACERGKRDLERSAEAGNLARLSGTIRGSANISICMKEVSVAPSLEKLEASAIVGGQGAVDLGIKYVPQDIAGYLDCQFPWAESKRTKIELPDQSAKLDAALVLDTSTSNPTLQANVKTSALIARIRPSLHELLLGSYSMRAACAPVGAMLHEVTLDLTPSIPEIDGDFSLPGKGRTLVLTLEPMTFRLAGTNLIDKAAYVSNAKALILSGDQSAVPAN
jgi:hypothetical protein